MATQKQIKEAAKRMNAAVRAGEISPLAGRNGEYGIDPIPEQHWAQWKRMARRMLDAQGVMLLDQGDGFYAVATTMKEAIELALREWMPPGVEVLPETLLHIPPGSSQEMMHLAVLMALDAKEE